MEKINKGSFKYFALKCLVKENCSKEEEQL